MAEKPVPPMPSFASLVETLEQDLCEPKGDSMLKLLAKILGIPEAPKMPPGLLLELAEEEILEVAKVHPVVLPVTVAVVERLEQCAAMTILNWHVPEGALAEEPWILINNTVCSEIKDKELYKAGVVRHEVSHVLHNIRVIEAAGCKPGDPPPCHTAHTEDWEAVAREIGVVSVDSRGTLTGYEPAFLGVPESASGTKLAFMLFQMGTACGLDPRSYSKHLAKKTLR